MPDAVTTSDEARVRAEYARRNAEVPASRYHITQPSALFAYQSQRRHAADMLALPADGLRGSRILDVGCGSGQWLIDCESWGAAREDLHGIDLLEERVAAARQRLPGADIRCGSARELPWQHSSFDLLIASTLMSSVLDTELQDRIASEMMRVLRPGGVLLWYDMAVDNPRNRNVRGIPAARLEQLFRACRIDSRRITLFPWLARALAPHAWTLATFLESMKVLNTHIMALVHKPAAQG